MREERTKRADRSGLLSMVWNPHKCYSVGPHFVSRTLASVCNDMVTC